MALVQGLLRVSGFLFVAAMALLVVVGMLRGTIRTQGLLGKFNAVCVQLFIATLSIAVVYVVAMVRRPASDQLPRLSILWLVLLSASNGVYLSSKFLSARKARP